ncbi:MAG: hypothetical protein M1831_004548 [Alyxoria varia]|nr:MAG: hypothetical protein M1831_004548 [Alyxoria varia]
MAHLVNSDEDYDPSSGEDDGSTFKTKSPLRHAEVRRLPLKDLMRTVWYWAGPEKPIRRGMRPRRVLPEHVKSDFVRKTFVCYVYENLEPDQEEDLFARVQKGVELTPPEKIRATSGPWQTLAKLFEQDFPQVVRLSAHERAVGFRNILYSFAQIVEVRQLGSSNIKTPPFRYRVEQLPAFCKNTQACDDAMRSHLRRVFQTYQKLVEKDPLVFTNDQWRKSPKFSPVELIAVAVMVSIHQNSRSEELLLEDVRYMRSHIRDQGLSDLRLGRTAWRMLWAFISEIEEFRGPGDISEPAPVFNGRSQSASSFSAAENRTRKPASLSAPSSKSSMGPPPMLPRTHEVTRDLADSDKSYPDPVPWEHGYPPHPHSSHAISNNRNVPNSPAPLATMHSLPDRSFRPPVTSPAVASPPLMSPTTPSETDLERKRAFQSSSNKARELLAKRRRSGTNVKHESGV